MESGQVRIIRHPPSSLLVAAACAACWGTAQAQTPLRYDFSPGQRLVYERRASVQSLENGRPLSEHREQIQCWCLAKDLKEDFLLVELLRADEQKPTAGRTTAFNIDHRGQRRLSPEMAAQLEGCDPIFELFPMLPTALESADAWLTPPDHLGRRWSCRRLPGGTPDAIRIEFTLSDPTGVAEFRRQAQHGIATFDGRVGCVSRLEIETTDQEAGRRVQAVTVLHARLATDEIWRRQRLQEWEKAQRVLRQHDRLLDGLWNERLQPEWAAAELERLWSELEVELSGTRDNPLHRFARARLGLVRQDRPRLLEQGEVVSHWLGARAAHWSLQTPEGRTLASESLRDRWMLEYFWSATSPESLRCFELLRQLGAELPPEKLAVVCINIDADAALAGRAIALCGGGLTHVLAGAPLDGTPPRDLPIYRLLAPDSRIHALYFGRRPDLARYISARIR